jgi:hypothetical protein
LISEEGYVEAGPLSNGIVIDELQYHNVSSGNIPLNVDLLCEIIDPKTKQQLFYGMLNFNPSSEERHYINRGPLMAIPGTVFNKYLNKYLPWYDIPALPDRSTFPTEKLADPDLYYFKMYFTDSDKRYGKFIWGSFPKSKTFSHTNGTSTTYSWELW